MIAFRAKPALVLGLCLLFSYTSLASISPSITLSAANDRGLDNILQRTAAQDGSSAETSYDYDSAPWQPNPSHHNIDEAARYEDLPPSVFSPTGRLHPVEAVVRASKARTPLSNLLVAMVCRDGLLVVSTLPISPNVDASKEMSNEEGHASDDNSKRNGESSSAVADKSENDDDDSVVDTTSDDDDEALQSPSLFLFDETCISTGTGSIFDIHPCIVGATAGNAVDNRIMRTKLLALGLNAMDHQGSTEQDVSTARVAKDLANQLQVTTQDIAAAQKQKLGRMLAVSVKLIVNFLKQDVTQVAKLIVTYFTFLTPPILCSLGCISVRLFFSEADKYGELTQLVNSGTATPLC